MRYLTRELWLGANTSDRSRASQEQWSRNLEAYNAQLTSLRPRLTPRVYRFFTQSSLHDGRLISLNLGDHVPRRSMKSQRSEPFAVVDAVDVDQKRHHILEYLGIRRLVFDYPSDQPLFHATGGPIGDWGYDELTAADDVFLRHEVLFSSGTILLVEFRGLKHHVR